MSYETQNLELRTQIFFMGSRAEVFLALAACVVPAEGLGAPGAGSEATLQAAEEFVQGQEAAVRAKLGLLLRVFEWGALFRFGARFTRLAAAVQSDYLRAWQLSPIQTLRFGFSSLRNLALLAFYTRPESWDMIGYPGPQHGSRSLSATSQAAASSATLTHVAEDVER